MPYNTSLNLTRYIGAPRLVARRLALRYSSIGGVIRSKRFVTFRSWNIKPFSFIAQIAVVILVSSCASPVPRLMNDLTNARICCERFIDMPYEKLSLQQEATFAIDEKSPVYEFETGKSFFKAFELPRNERPYSVSLRSYLVGIDYPVSYIFVPSVILLSENFQITRVIDPRHFQFAVPGLTETWGFRAMLEGFIHVDTQDAKERYMVIYTGRTLLGKKVTLYRQTAIPIILPGIVGAIPAGAEAFQVPASPTGRMRVVFND
jgi:hypothetical protein